MKNKRRERNMDRDTVKKERDREREERKRDSARVREGREGGGMWQAQVVATIASDAGARRNVPASDVSYDES